MKSKFVHIIFFVIMIVPQIFAGKVHYVDATNGNDLNDGLSPETAWQTVGKVNNSMNSFDAGDYIYFKRGETFSDATLTITRGGIAGSPIIFGAYGNGDKPIITSSNGCVRGSTNNTGYITVQGLALTNSTNASAVSFHADNMTNITISCCDIYNIPNHNGIVLLKISTYVIESCTIYNINNSGIAIMGSDTYQITNGIIHNNIIYDIAGNDGITLHHDGSSNPVGPNHTIKNNTIYNCFEQALDIGGSSSNITILNNETYNNGAGIIIGTDDSHINRHYSHGDHNGIIISSSQNIRVTNTIIRDSDYHELVIVNSCTNFEFYHNTLVHKEGNTQSIIDVDNWGTGNPLGLVIKNNIFITRGEDNLRFIRYLGTKTPSNTNSDFDCNIWWRSDNDNNGLWYAGGNTYNFVQWQSTWSQDINGYWNDPYLVDPYNNDFHLLSNSQAIDNGFDVGVSEDYDNYSRPQGYYPDIGAYEYESAAPLNANMNASPSSGYVPLTIDFTGNATGGSSPYTYSWNFGDGTSSSTQNPSHTYSAAGDYTTILTVTDSASNQDSEYVTINAVNPSPLVASLIASPTSGQVPLTVSFTGSASGGTSPYYYSWNFGDGASSSTQNPSHTYSTAGDYTATLTVTDSASNQDSESVTIDASAPHTVTTPNTPSGSTNGSPNATYSYTSGGSSCSQGHSIEYRFDWGDGAYSAWSSSTIASHSWPAAGSYAVKAQARCSINHSIVSGWSSETTVTIATSSYFNLAVSSATGSPTPGQGGTTDPSPGNHSYPSGNSVLVSAITNTDYRFSKWAGDVSSSNTYDEEISVSMNQNKSISAYFCTKCGDVNGDLNITPADAQEVFEIFLGIISDPTDCQKENADVNCDGTKTDPKITPGDAQAIFEKFLGINDLPGDCSCKSRAESAGTLTTQERAFVQLERSTNINLIINDIELKPGKIIAVPVIIDNPSNIKAFGFDILFESEILEFVGVVRTELLKDFNEADGNEIAQGVLRVGGYSSEPIRSYSPGALIILIFKVTGETEEPCPFLITNTVDDLENASFQNRTYMREKIRRKEIVF